MVSDAQILKTQTCFLQEMAQKERIQPSTVDLVHLVPFCLSLVTTTGTIEMSGRLARPIEVFVNPLYWAP